MEKLRNKLIVLAAVAVLAAVGTLMTSHPAKAADGGPTVTIGGPLPLPVTVTGPSAITGTVALAPGSSVLVNNPSTNPVHVKMLSTPFFQSSAPVCDAVNRCTVTFPVVPPGKFLRVTRIHGAMYFLNADAFVALDLNNTNGQLFVMPVHPFNAAYLGSALSFNEATDIVFTAGQVPIVEMGTTGSFVTTSFNRLGITGDLEDAQ
jgi:hypothetical protein